MPIFEYKALDAAGKIIKGSIDAETAKAAKQKLKKNELFPTEIREKSAAKSKSTGRPSGGALFSRLKIQDIALATRQLASLVRANIPLVDALKALIEQTEHEKLQVIFEEVRKDVNEGSSLAKALAKHPRAFNNVFINMVEAGETSGT
ncbi:MAG TPA: type II secretion system F family protein, partial [Oligoflexia bacterium]|nr:type II secretion system F family protein [Oligoflexia bacterium]